VRHSRRSSRTHHGEHHMRLAKPVLTELDMAAFSS